MTASFEVRFQLPSATRCRSLRKWPCQRLARALGQTPSLDRCEGTYDLCDIPSLVPVSERPRRVCWRRSPCSGADRFGQRRLTAARAAERGVWTPPKDHSSPGATSNTIRPTSLISSTSVQRCCALKCWQRTSHKQRHRQRQLPPRNGCSGGAAHRGWCCSRAVESPLMRLLYCLPRR